MQSQFNWTRLLLGLSFVLSMQSIASAQFVRIEEDWELHVLQPDQALDAPQVTTTMRPFGEDSDVLFQVDVNHGSTPDFEPNGLQVRVCDGDHLLDDKRLKTDSILSHSAETVRWTQVLLRTENGYLFGITNGTSLSFGSFGGIESFTYVTHSQTGSDNLQAYSHERSLSSSGVTYAGNRVGWMRLKEVRVFDASGVVNVVSVNEDVE